MQENHYRLFLKTLDDAKQLSPLANAAICIMRDNMAQDIIHDESHILRVLRNALWFGEEGNQDVIIVASILHDLVNIPKDSPDRNQASLRSALRATYELEHAYDIKDFELLGNVFHSIQAHSWSANVEPTTIEAKSIQDADRLEGIGYLGLARMFAMTSVLNRQLFNPIDPLAKNRELDERKY